MNFDTFLGALIGAILSFIIPLTWEWVKLLRSPLRPSAGKWLSRYKPSAMGKEWSNEEVQISYRLGRIKLTSINNELGHLWEGEAKFVDNRYLVGELHSIKPGARTMTQFILVIHQQGDCLYGKWLKPSNKNIVLSGQWVLGKTEADIEIAKQHVQNIRQPAK